MRSLRRVAGLGLVIAATAVFLWRLSRRDGPSPPPALPAAADVERISARCPAFEGVFPETAEFPVPPEYVPDVLRVLGSPGPAEDLTRASHEVATLRIGCRGGREVTVRVYFYGKEPARYSIDGRHCVRGGAYVGDTEFPLVGGSPRYLDESNLIAAMLRVMEHQPMTDQARSAVRSYLRRLDRSAGRE